ncbi:hypothetical protein [Kocuria sp. U4B]
MAVKYGRPDELWERTRDVARSFIEDVNERKGETYYSAVNDAIKAAGLPGFNLSKSAERRALGALLGEISEESYNDYGVMLTAIVKYKGKDEVGGDFWNLAVYLGRLTSVPTPDEMKGVLDELIAEVHEHYPHRVKNI